MDETRSAGVSVATVAQAHGINANQLFSWRKLDEAGQLEIAGASSSRELGTPSMHLLPVTVDEVVERQELAAVASRRIGAASCGSDLQGSIELTLARGQVRIAGQVDAGTLRTVLRCLLA